MMLASSCKKEEPDYSERMLMITRAPWKWISYQVKDSTEIWMTMPLGCVADNFYTFLPYEEPRYDQIMEIDYGAELCSPDEALGFMAYDYWAFRENETRIFPSGWSPTDQAGDILTLTNDTLRIQFAGQDSLEIPSVEILLTH